MRYGRRSRRVVELNARILGATEEEVERAAEAVGCALRHPILRGLAPRRLIGKGAAIASIR